MIPYTKLTAVFSLHIMLYGRIRMVVWRLYGKQAAVRVSTRELVCNSQTTIRIMNKDLTLGTDAVPAHLMNKASKTFRELVNRVLPQECRIETASDGWYVGAIASACLMLVFPPAVGALAYCVMRAKREGGAQ